ncbi:hypothetical protein AAG906_021394 [Vitis piasezkii]
MLCVASSKVLISKLGEVYGVGLWKAIKKEGDVLSCRVSFLVGDSRRVRFWKDKWYGDEPLCISFPSLFVVASSKEVWVELVWSHSLREAWSASFEIAWEEVSRTKRMRLCGESKDRTFFVKSLFRAWELGRQAFS